MIRSVTFVIPFAMAAPAFAGGPPISHSEGSASSTARVNLDAETDTAELNAIFGSVDTEAYRDLLADGQLRGRSIADSTLTVQQFNPRDWSARAFMTANAFSNNTNEAFAETRADYIVDFTLSAGRFFQFSGSLGGGFFGDEDSTLVLEYGARIYREGVLQHERLLPGQGSFSFNTSVEEVGAAYRVEYVMLVTAATSGVTDAMSAAAEINAGVRVSIIPAPMTAAPLAFGALLAARRRRA